MKTFDVDLFNTFPFRTENIVSNHNAEILTYSTHLLNNKSILFTNKLFSQ